MGQTEGRMSLREVVTRRVSKDGKAPRTWARAWMRSRALAMSPCHELLLCFSPGIADGSVAKAVPV